MTWQVVVPGTQTVTVVSGMFCPRLEWLTDTATTFDGGLVAVSAAVDFGRANTDWLVAARGEHPAKNRLQMATRVACPSTRTRCVGCTALPTRNRVAEFAARARCLRSRQPSGASKEAYVSSRQPCVSSRDACGSTKDACGSSKDAHGSSKDAHGSSKDAYGSSKDAYVSSKDAYVSSKAAYVSSKDAYVSSQDASRSSKDERVSSKDAYAASRDA
jgi:hypothetical protein